MNEIHVNDIIRFRGQIWQIRSHDGLDLQLKCLDDGNVCTLPAAVIISDETFVGPQDNRPSIADQRRLDAAPPQRRREAEFWSDQATVPFGVDVVKAIARDLGRKKVSDKRILERAEAIHQQLLAGPPETKQRPLTRAEAQAGRANLVRQELCTPPPIEATFQGPSMRAPESPVVPMEQIDLTKGW